MNLKQFPAAAMRLIDAGVAIEVIGPPGVGKTAAIRQLRKKLSERDGFEWGLSEVLLTSYSPQDVAGYLIPGKDADGVWRARFTEPAFFTQRDGRPLSEFKRSIVLADEMAQADPDVKKAFSGVLLEGKAGTHALPPGTARIAASNRSKDRSGVTKSYDHITNRRAELHIVPDLDAWLDWANEAGMRPEFTAFASHHFDVVFSGEVPARPGPWCTPRSLHLLADTLTVGLDVDAPIPDDSETLEIAEGLVGDAGPQLFAMIRLRNQLPAYEEILSRPDRAGVPEKPDAIMLVLHLLAARVTNPTMEAVTTYLRRLPGEFAVPFGTMALRRDTDLVNSKAFSTWAMEHAALTQAITAARR